MSQSLIIGNVRWVALNTIRFCFTKVQKEVQTDVGIA